MIRDRAADLLLRYGERRLLPDFSNRLTWAVVIAGLGLAVTPIPISAVVFGWLIKRVGELTGIEIPLFQFEPTTSDRFIGFGFVLVALAHNIITKRGIPNANHAEASTEQRPAEVDIALFSEFINMFSSNSRSAKLLKNCDFGGMFSTKDLESIDVFSVEWNCPEKQFLDPGLEDKREALRQKCEEFNLLIASKTSPTHNGLQSVVSDYYRAGLWPDWLENDVQVVNRVATELYGQHQEFVGYARHVLER